MLRGEGTEDLIEEADLDGTGRSSTGLTAVFDTITGVERIVQLSAIDCDLVAETRLQ